MDTTQERHNELMREEITRRLAERGIDAGELAWQLRRIWLHAGCPCGADVTGFIMWVERI